MSTYSVARLAESDVNSIVRYTMKTWGREQTKRYNQDLRECFQILADNPSLGRTCDSIRPGLHRFERGKHVVFYISIPDGILVARVLHQKMVPAKSHFGQ